PVGRAVSVLPAQPGSPLLRLSDAEDGGELGRAGAVAAAGVLLVLVGSAATGYVRLPPLAPRAAGVPQGPIVIHRREVLQGSPGAVVKGGIVVAHDDVHIHNVTVLGGQ